MKRAGAYTPFTRLDSKGRGTPVWVLAAFACFTEHDSEKAVLKPSQRI